MCRYTDTSAKCAVVGKDNSKLCSYGRLGDTTSGLHAARLTRHVNPTLSCYIHYICWSPWSVITYESACAIYLLQCNSSASQILRARERV